MQAQVDPFLPFRSNLRLGGKYLSPEFESDQFGLTTNANVCGKIRKIGEKCGAAIGCLRGITPASTSFNRTLKNCSTTHKIDFFSMQNFPPAFPNDCHWWEGESKSGAINRWGRTSAHFSRVGATLSLCTSSFARLFVLPICGGDIPASGIYNARLSRDRLGLGVTSGHSLLWHYGGVL